MSGSSRQPIGQATRRNKTRTQWQRWRNPGLAATIATIALAGVVTIQQQQLDRASQTIIQPKQAEQQEALRLRLLKQMPAFGFDNLFADWVFLNFLQYYGDTPARTQTSYSLSQEYFDVITRRDPRFVEVYLFVSGTLSYQLGNPKLAIEFMNRGTTALAPQMHPKAYQVWRFKGLDQLLLLGDIAGSIRSHEKAAQWVKGTPDADLAPLYEATAAFLRQDPDSVPVRIQAWSSVYDQAKAVNDRQTQERAKQAILSLGGEMKVQPDGRVEFLLPKSPTRKSSTKPSQKPSTPQRSER